MEDRILNEHIELIQKELNANMAHAHRVVLDLDECPMKEHLMQKLGEVR